MHNTTGIILHGLLRCTYFLSVFFSICVNFVCVCVLCVCEFSSLCVCAVLSHTHTHPHRRASFVSGGHIIFALQTLIVPGRLSIVSESSLCVLSAESCVYSLVGRDYPLIGTIRFRESGDCVDTFPEQGRDRYIDSSQLKQTISACSR
jgi:hypothetical protein